ncbi:MAG: hypothetical protein J7M40_20535 [Planctomycetes bacterium]|nr:hypothetical protein [Planctomycetota bacterium]
MNKIIILLAGGAAGALLWYLVAESAPIYDISVVCPLDQCCRVLCCRYDSSLEMKLWL